MIEKLPVPFGLVRFGVAPDHQQIKNVTRIYDRIANDENFTLLGNVVVGRDIKVSEMKQCFDQKVLPVDWDQMEIEAKWEGSKKKFDKMVKALAHNSERYGYTLQVRWNGIARKFVDIYYDTKKGDLAKENHILRYRMQLNSHLMKVKLILFLRD